MAKHFSPTATNRNRADILARLEPYWKMEAGNIIGVPLIVLVLTKAQIGWVTLVPLAATMFLLGIGAVYWRMKVRQLRGEAANEDQVLTWLTRLQVPSLLLTLAGITVAALGWIAPHFSTGQPDRIAASACALLAALEYVNYYHRQVQHFDNKADFKRMLAGKGFRPSWMARDLAAWRGRG